MTAFLDTYVQPVADFIAAHPLLGSIVVFLLALSESLPVIGAVSPGTATILAISVLAGLGYMPLWAVLIAALLGAIAGDGVAYWFGHRYQAQALQMWPLARHPKMISTSQEFFARHGGKSIMIARFTPVVRAFVPLIAGVSGMRPARFYTANAASAVAWALSHILPAAAAGASLGILHQVSGRLAAVLVAVLVAAFALYQAMRLTLRWGSAALIAAQSRAHAALEGRTGRLAHILGGLTHPEDGSAREVAFLGAIFAVAGVLLFNLVEGVLARGALMRADQAISALVGSWRTGFGDSLMVTITALGDTPVTSIVALVAAVWTWWKGDRRMSLGIVAALATMALFVVGLKATMQVARPSTLYSNAHPFSFPSGHTTFAASLYGILGWLWWRALQRPWRTAVFGATTSFVAAIAVSRIYLQAHWPSDVAAGLVFGLGVTAAFALAFKSVDIQRLEPLRLLTVVLVALASVGTWHAMSSHAEGLEIYARRPSATVTTTAVWRQTDWQKVPARRVDLGGEREEPIVLQWAGSADMLSAALARDGWEPSVGLNLVTAGAYLSGGSTALTLPVLPRLDDGRAPILSLVRATRAHGAREILHVWTTALVLSDRGNAPVLIGAVVHDRVLHPLSFLSLPSSLAPAPAAVVSELAGILPSAQMVMRPAVNGAEISVVLASGPSQP